MHDRYRAAAPLMDSINRSGSSFVSVYIMPMPPNARSACAAAHRYRRHRFLDIYDTGLGGQEHRGSGCRVLQRASGYLRRIDDTCFDHVDIFFGRRIQTNAYAAALHFSDNHAAFQTRVLRDLAYRFLQRSRDDRSTGLHVACQRFYISLDCRNGVD